MMPLASRPLTYLFYAAPVIGGLVGVGQMLHACGTWT